MVQGLGGDGYGGAAKGWAVVARCKQKDVNLGGEKNRAARTFNFWIKKRIEKNKI